MRQFGDLLLEADEAVAEFVRSRIKGKLEPFVNYKAIGVIRNGNLVGGIVYHDYVKHDIMASAAFSTLRWWKEETVRYLFEYPFKELGCVRVSIMTATHNQRTRSIVERLGFKQEGIHPLRINGTDDAITYGMLRSNCTWIKDA